MNPYARVCRLRDVRRALKNCFRMNVHPQHLQELPQTGKCGGRSMATFEEPTRSQMASVAVRAALETERGLADPRFQECRSDGHIVVSITPELKDFGLQLGNKADELAGQETRALYWESANDVKQVFSTQFSNFLDDFYGPLLDETDELMAVMQGSRSQRASEHALFQTIADRALDLIQGIQNLSEK